MAWQDKLAAEGVKHKTLNSNNFRDWRNKSDCTRCPLHEKGGDHTEAAKINTVVAKEIVFTRMDNSTRAKRK